LIGGKVDLDHLSLFPKKYSRSMRGMVRKGKLFKVHNGGEKMEVLTSKRGRRGFI
jgi:hypothetical protein